MEIHWQGGKVFQFLRSCRPGLQAVQVYPTASYVLTQRSRILTWRTIQRVTTQGMMTTQMIVNGRQSLEAAGRALLTTILAMAMMIFVDYTRKWYAELQLAGESPATSVLQRLSKHDKSQEVQQQQQQRECERGLKHTTALVQTFSALRRQHSAEEFAVLLYQTPAGALPMSDSLYTSSGLYTYCLPVPTCVPVCCRLNRIISLYDIQEEGVVPLKR